MADRQELNRHKDLDHLQLASCHFDPVIVLQSSAKIRERCSDKSLPRPEEKQQLLYSHSVVPPKAKQTPWLSCLAPA
jgi:hypothetical protein